MYFKHVIPAFKSKKTNNLKKRVIVVGGGYAGTYAAKKLQHDFDVTLIDAKEYYEFTPSRLRTLSEPWHAFKVKLLYDSLLSKTRVVTERVQYITEDEVVTERNSVFKYHYLIVTTGSRYKEAIFPPISNSYESLPRNNLRAKIISARAPNFELYHQLIDESSKILIIGGGTVGVELAGEISEFFDGKQVTLIHSQSHLMNRSPEKAARHAEQFCKVNNINLVVGERIVEQTGLYFKSDLGNIYEADIAFICTGNVPNSELFKPAFTESLNRYGFAKVNKHLQLHGFNNIFVAGDLTDIPEEEEKLCQTAFDEIKVVIKNIINFEKGSALVDYTPAPCPMLISLGKYDGILTYKSWAFTGIIPAVMKEFVEWKEMVYYWKLNHFSLRSQKTDIDASWRVGALVV